MTLFALNQRSRTTVTNRSEKLTHENEFLRHVWEGLDLLRFPRRRCWPHLVMRSLEPRGLLHQRIHYRHLLLCRDGHAHAGWVRDAGGNNRRGNERRCRRRRWHRDEWCCSRNVRGDGRHGVRRRGHSLSKTRNHSSNFFVTSNKKIRNIPWWRFVPRDSKEADSTVTGACSNPTPCLLAILDSSK